MQKHPALAVDKLYTPCDPDQLDFETTDDLDELKEVLGQDRAVEAVRFGAGMQHEGFNLFVLGPNGTGRHSFIRQFLEQKAEHEPAPSDWCYVNNFEQPKRPNALRFPAGRGRKFQQDVRHLVEEAQSAIPAAFESEDYQARRQSIQQELKEEQENALQEVQQHAQEKNIGIIPTRSGFAFAPIRDGETLSPDEFSELPEKEQERIEKETEELGNELRKVMQEAPKRTRKIREKIQQLDREVTMFAVGSLIDELVEKYRDLPEVAEHLQAMQRDIVDNVEMFLKKPGDEKQEVLEQLLGGKMGGGQEPGGSSVTHRYDVNVIVDHTKNGGAPVVFEDNPTYNYVVGQVEHLAQMGALVTDFSLIKGGALHQANGGYLVLDARKILTEPFAWDGLKRALRSGEIRIQSPGQAYSLVSTVSLEPEPIPLDIKIVLIGDRWLYYLLQALDPEFNRYFKVAADFEDDMDRNPDNISRFAQLLGNIARKEKLRPLHRNAVARIIEESARHAGDSEKLSARVRYAADIAREAHFWAGESGSDIIGVDEIQRAIDSRIHRASRIRDRIQEEILRETILIDTDSAVTGQINGLSVMQIGEYAFGRPSRITARLSVGPGKVIDIEREVELGGPIHSKGVLILSNFLSSQYVTDRPLSLSASLVFEQSYGGIEGDSASTAELCTLLSALAQVPIRQSLAVTGSINQHGHIQAIGGVNEKIEGFFDICQARDLTGDQGVLIPEANVPHLMLRKDVRDAVEGGQFHIYPVQHIDQCLEILTDREAGEADEQGNFPAESINRRIQERLIAFSDQLKAFGGSPGSGED